MKKKILLLNPPYKYPVIRDYYCCFASKANYLWPPIDLLVLSGILKNDYQLKVIDAIAENLTYEKCEKKITSSNYFAIIFLTGTATYKSDFSFLEEIGKKIKSKFIASGNIVIFNSLEFLQKYDFLDAIIMDFTSNDILKYLKDDYSKIKLISYKKRGDKDKLFISKRQLSREEFFYPIPLHNLFPLEKYKTPIAKRFPLTSILSSFGCPFSCSFCIGSTLTYKPRKIENVISELKHIQNLQIKEVFFEDNTFLVDKDRTKTLCKKIIENKIDISWSVNIHSRIIDRETFLLMKKAGCHTIQIGVESASDEVLKRYKKATNRNIIRKTFRLAKEVGLQTLGYFIIGLPGETYQSSLLTIEFAKELDPTYVSFSLITPDHGTDFRKEAIKRGWFRPDLKNEEFDSSLTSVIETEKLSRKQQDKLIKKAYISFYLRPGKIISLLLAKKSPSEIWQTIKAGFALIFALLKNISARNNSKTSISIAMVVYSHYSRDARVRRYAEALARKKNCVDIISLRENYQPQEKNINLVMFPVSRARLGRFWYLVEYTAFFLYAFFLLSVKSLFKNYQIIHVHNMPDILVFTAVLPKLLGAKVILDMHDPMPELYISKYHVTEQNLGVRLLTILEKLSFHFADLIITANPEFKKIFLLRTNISQNKISVILNCPDPRIFNRQKAKDDRQQFTLLYMGTIDERFGLDIAIDSIPLLIQKIPKLKFIIIPKIRKEGEYFKNLKRKVQKAKLENYVFFLSPLPLEKIAERIKEADIGIVLAKNGVFTDSIIPVKLLEFVKMDVPVIATKTKALSKYFDNYSFYFLPQNTPKAFAQAVLTLWQNKSLREKLAKNARGYLQQNNWSKEERKYLHLLRT